MWILDCTIGPNGKASLSCKICDTKTESIPRLSVQKPFIFMTIVVLNLDNVVECATAGKVFSRIERVRFADIRR